MGKSVKSPTGKPSKVKDEVKDFDKGNAGGGKKTSAYSKKAEPKAKSKSKTKAKPSYLGTGTASKAAKALSKETRERRERKQGL